MEYLYNMATMGTSSGYISEIFTKKLTIRTTNEISYNSTGNKLSFFGTNNYIYSPSVNEISFVLNNNTMLKVQNVGIYSVEWRPLTSTDTLGQSDVPFNECHAVQIGFSGTGASLDQLYIGSSTIPAKINNKTVSIINGNLTLV